MKRKSCSLLATMAAISSLGLATSAPSAIRGGGNGGRGGGAIRKNNNNDDDDDGGGAKKKNTRRDRKRRPAIQDANYHDKIRNWQRRQLEELCGEGGCHRQDSSSSSSSSSSGADDRRRRRRRQQALHHKKSNGYGVVEVAKAPDLGFHTLPSGPTTTAPPPPPAPIYQQHGPPPSNPAPPAAAATTIAEATPASSIMVANSSSGQTTTTTTTDDGANPYYPLYTSTKTVGTCSNNGNEPDQFRDAKRASLFLFATLEECCDEWYLDPVGCLGGFAHVNEDGELLKRNWVTGEPMPVHPNLGQEEEEEGLGVPAGVVATTLTTNDDGNMVSNSASGFAGSIGTAFASDGNNSGGNAGGDAGNNIVSASDNNKYYPSFNVRLYPDGACLDDGAQPPGYSLNSADYLFDDLLDCCEEWFVDIDACLAASSASSSDDGGATMQQQSSEGGGGDEDPAAPSPFPTWFDSDDEDSDETPWPTWADAQLKNDAADQVYAASDDQNPSSSAAAGDSRPAPDLFFESFESGDFAVYDWSRPASEPPGSYARADPWEADLTAMAYDGRHAARPGVLGVPGSQSNLTISLEGLDVTSGGLLTFAVHAAVEMPVDALYFTINHEVIRTFDAVTGDAGSWTEVSVILQPGEHTLTWSYQYYGLPSEEWEAEHGPYEMDLRRMGNSWVDAIALSAFTGSVSFSDDDDDAHSLLLLSQEEDSSGGADGGVASWALTSDAKAFLGAHSYIAYTEDIPGRQGAAELTWTIVAGPDGGILSFAAFASTYAPRDVLEFTVDSVPEIVIAAPSADWEQKYVEIDPGRHVVKWRLVKNPPGLSEAVVKGVEVPEGYQGFAKVDAIGYTDNAPVKTQTTTTTTTTSTTETTTTTSTTTTEEPTTTTTSTAEETTTTTTTEEPADDTTTTEATTTTTSTTTEGTGTTTEGTGTTTEGTGTTTEGTGTTTEGTGTTTEGTATTTEGTGTTTEGTATTTTTAPAADENTNADEPVAQSEEKTDAGCPEGLQPVEGLPGCCLDEPNYLGDGACDPRAPYNTEACAFDLGDCCRETCNTDSPYGCLTKEGDADYGPFGFFCIDPRYGTIDEAKCLVDNREWMGDGGCDAEGGYNTEECGWDMGDCCEETCDTKFSFYPCGQNQEYTCLDPSVGGGGGGGEEETQSDPTGSGGGEETQSDPSGSGGGGETQSDPTGSEGGGETQSDPTGSEGGVETQSDPTGSEGEGETQSDPTGSNVYEYDKEVSSPYYFSDSFESGDGTFDQSHWRSVNVPGSDASWEIEREDPDVDKTSHAFEGARFAEARTHYIIHDRGTAALELSVSSPEGGGGTLTYALQAFVRAPFEDLVVTVDGEVVSDHIVMEDVPEWEERTLLIGPGMHAVRWVLRKNPTDAPAEELAEAGGGSISRGIARIDHVVFRPN